MARKADAEWRAKRTPSGAQSGPPGGEVDDQYSRYRYDGQMPMETYVIKADSSTVLTDYGLGARGLDYTSVTNSSGTTVVFPIYDAHGNEVASLSRSGSSYSLSNQRSYGAWGEIRQGNTTGGPRGRYSGNLGHIQDDETGLVYMRARYYEPGSGRFLSEDTQEDGPNWYTYCLNSPTNLIDENGHSPAAILVALAQIAGFMIGFMLGYYLMSAFFEHQFPGYKASNKWAIAGGTFMAGIGSVLLLGAASGGGSILNMSITAMAKTIMRSIAQTGVAILGLVAADAFFIGLLVGLYNAELEFFISDQWRDAVS